VDPETVTIIQMNQTEEKLNEKKIYWFPPEKPNGFVLAYRAKLIRDDDSVLLILLNKFEHKIISQFRLRLNAASPTTSLKTNPV
jgi:hypothetical protein